MSSYVFSKLARLVWPCPDLWPYSAYFDTKTLGPLVRIAPSLNYAYDEYEGIIIQTCGTNSDTSQDNSFYEVWENATSQNSNPHCLTGLQIERQSETLEDKKDLISNQTKNFSNSPEEEKYTNHILDELPENAFQSQISSQLVVGRVGFSVLGDITARTRNLSTITFADKEVQVGNGWIETNDLACQTSFSATSIDPSVFVKAPVTPIVEDAVQRPTIAAVEQKLGNIPFDPDSKSVSIRVAQEVVERGHEHASTLLSCNQESSEDNNNPLDEYFKETNESLTGDVSFQTVVDQHLPNKEVLKDDHPSKQVDRAVDGLPSPSESNDRAIIVRPTTPTKIELGSRSLLSSAKKLIDFVNIQATCVTKNSTKARFAQTNPPKIEESDNSTPVQKQQQTSDHEYSFKLTQEGLSAHLCWQYSDPNDWKYVVDLNLNNKGIESVCRLDHLMPKLEKLTINNNLLEYLTGLPSSLTNLYAAGNRLTSMTDFSHLPNLQYLDISRNHIKDMTDLRGLANLRNLKADDNHIRSFDGVFCLKSLQKMSLRRNKFEEVDFSTSNLSLLESLDLSENRISSIKGIGSLRALKYLDLEKNELKIFDPRESMEHLLCLKLGSNHLTEFNVKRLPNLRIIFLDCNELTDIQHSEMLTRLVTLSARCQKGGKTHLHLRHFREAGRLYLSGTLLPKLESMTEFFKLELLELSAVGLRELPERFYDYCPGVLYINLNCNELKDIRPLRKLKRLKQLAMFGNQLSDNEMVIEVVKRLPTLKYCDFRNNPITSNYYPPLPVSPNTSPKNYELPLHVWDITEAQDWKTRDKAFCKDMTDDVFVRRNFYRLSIFRKCPNMVCLDGLAVGEADRWGGKRLYEKLEVYHVAQAVFGEI